MYHWMNMYTGEITENFKNVLRTARYYFPKRGNSNLTFTQRLKCSFMWKYSHKGY